MFIPSFLRVRPIRLSFYSSDKYLQSSIQFWLVHFSLIVRSSSSFVERWCICHLHTLLSLDWRTFSCSVYELELQAMLSRCSVVAPFASMPDGLALHKVLSGVLLLSRCMCCYLLCYHSLDAHLTDLLCTCYLSVSLFCFCTGLCCAQNKLFNWHV